LAEEDLQVPQFGEASRSIHRHPRLSWEGRQAEMPNHQVGVRD
jgi:hypothetical protein